MVSVIQAAGQSALLLATVVVLLALVYAAAWLLESIYRRVKRLQSVAGRPERPARMTGERPVRRIGRKW